MIYLKPLPAKVNMTLLRLLKKLDQRGLSFLVKKYRKHVIFYVNENGGTQKQGEQIFQAAVDSIVDIILRGKLNQQIDVQKYFIRICINHWNKEAPKSKLLVKFGNNEDQCKINSAEEDFINNEQYNIAHQSLEQQFAKLRSRCQKILTYYYYDRLKLDQIANKLKSKSTDSIKTQKNDCINGLRALVIADIRKKNRIAYDNR